MQAELKSLQIDRTKKSPAEPSRWAVRWIIGGVLVFVLLGAARFGYDRLNAATEVAVVRVQAESPAAAGPGVILNATGYIVAAHRIEVASKVVGKILWIGVEKGDAVKAGQPLVRLEDDEYRAQVTQAWLASRGDRCGPRESEPGEGGPGKRAGDVKPDQGAGVGQSPIETGARRRASQV
jgi:HlyD family secretion protein